MDFRFCFLSGMCSILDFRRTDGSLRLPGKAGLQHLLVPLCQCPSQARATVAIYRGAPSGHDENEPDPEPKMVWLRGPMQPQCWQWKCSSMMGATMDALSPRKSFRFSARVRFTNECGECFAPARTVVTWSHKVSLRNTRT